MTLRLVGQADWLDISHAFVANPRSLSFLSTPALTRWWIIEIRSKLSSSSSFALNASAQHKTVLGRFFLASTAWTSAFSITNWCQTQLPTWADSLSLGRLLFRHTGACRRTAAHRGWERPVAAGSSGIAIPYNSSERCSARNFGLTAAARPGDTPGGAVCSVSRCASGLVAYGEAPRARLQPELGSIA